MDFTVKEIIDLAMTAGVAVNEKIFTEAELETVIIVKDHDGVKTAHFEEYPEEGAFKLG